MKKTLLVVGLFISVFLATSTSFGQLVINEIDYDQPGTDTAEFVEIKNTGTAPVNLDDYSLVFINGANLTAYDTIDLPNAVLPAGHYFVICSNSSTVINCHLDDGPDTNFIQNGNPDAVALFNLATLVDVVSYGGNTGAPYTETAGVPIGAGDSGTILFQGLSRFPDGVDTNDNSSDVTLRCTSPGLPNIATSTGCVAPSNPTAAMVSISGRVTDVSGRGLSNVIVQAKAMNGTLIGTVRSSPFGYFTVDGLVAGESYVISMSAKRYTFQPQVIQMRDSLDGLSFVADQQ